MNKAEDYLERATNPQQYDTEGSIDWGKEGKENSPTRQVLREYLGQNLEINGKRVLDIGSGVGQLFPLLKKMGASEIIGIEPSKKNIFISKKVYPDVEIIENSFENAAIDKKFGAIACVFVFEHIENAEKAFDKIFNLLESKGQLYLIVSNKEYHTKPRFGYKIDFAELGEGVIVSRTDRNTGVLYDIVRPIEYYLEAASAAGFKLKKQVEIKPTENFLKSKPQYQDFKNIAIGYLLIFEKTGR